MTGPATPATHPTRTATVPTVAVWRSLLELHTEVIGRLETALRERHGLSVTEFDVLVNLPQTGGLRHQELADRVVLTRSALTRLVDRLVGRGLVAREPDPGDLRGVRITLTAAGRTVRRESARTNGQVVRRELEARLPPDDLATLGRLLGRARGACDA